MRSTSQRGRPICSHGTSYNACLFPQKQGTKTELSVIFWGIVITEPFLLKCLSFVFSSSNFILPFTCCSHLASSRKSSLLIPLTVSSLAQYFHHYSLSHLSGRTLTQFRSTPLESATWHPSVPLLCRWLTKCWREWIFSVLPPSPLYPLFFGAEGREHNLKRTRLFLRPGSVFTICGNQGTSHRTFEP